MKPEIIAFDLNGTLLDLSALDPHFGRIFGSTAHREKWFEQLQVLWMTTIAAGAYQPFDRLADAALKMLAAKEGVALEMADRDSVLAQMLRLSPYPEVPAALEQLRSAGYRTVVLTNGTLKAARAQVEFAGLSGLLEGVFSVDEVGRYKPAPEPYLHVAERLGAKPGRILLVAAHGWDIVGAHQAGLITAFIARPRQALNPLATAPDHEAADLTELARKLA